MTLDIQCDMDAEYASTLLGLGDGKQRKGAAARKFLLCYNHSELFRDIDRELVEEGWAPAHTEPRPTRLY